MTRAVQPWLRAEGAGKVFPPPAVKTHALSNVCRAIQRDECVSRNVERRMVRGREVRGERAVAGGRVPAGVRG